MLFCQSPEVKSRSSFPEVPGSGPSDFHSPVCTTATPVNKGTWKWGMQFFYFHGISCTTSGKQWHEPNNCKERDEMCAQIEGDRCDLKNNLCCLLLASSLVCSRRMQPETCSTELQYLVWPLLPGLVLQINCILTIWYLRSPPTQTMLWFYSLRLCSEVKASWDSFHLGEAQASLEVNGKARASVITSQLPSLLLREGLRKIRLKRLKPALTNIPSVIASWNFL